MRSTASIPGYGHTLGNSLRRIILSSLPGAAVTRVKIAGVDHEFSAIDGRQGRRHRHPAQPEEAAHPPLRRRAVRSLTLKAKGVKGAHAPRTSKLPARPRSSIPSCISPRSSEKTADLDIEITVEKGLGYVAKEAIQKERVDIGAITLDAAFTPIRKANYEVENMRVGDRTDFNRLRLT